MNCMVSGSQAKSGIAVKTDIYLSGSDSETQSICPILSQSDSRDNLSQGSISF